MDILHVAPPFLAINEGMKYGGIERVIMSLVRHQRPSGHNIRIIAPSDSVVLGLIPTAPSIGVGEIYESTVDRDIVRQNTLSKMIHLSYVLAFAKSEPNAVLHVHDDYMAPFMPFVPNPALLTLHSPYEDFWMAEAFPIAPLRARNLVAISKRQKQIYESHGYSVPFVVYNGVDVEEFPFSSEKEGFLLSLSAILPFKGQDRAIRIAGMTGRDVVIAGNVGNEEYFSSKIKPKITHDLTAESDKISAVRRARNESQGAKVIYVGSVNDDQKKPLYASASAFLLPVNGEESFGLVAVEALAAGTPVLASGLGALPEIVKDGLTGFVCSNDEEFIGAIDFLEKVSPYACRASAEQEFSSAAMAKQYLDLYKEIAGLRG